MRINKNILKRLYHPPPDSHKGDNGVLTIIAGSIKYHGAPLLAIKIAAKIVDLIYFFSTAENQALAQKLKEKSCLFINLVNQADLLDSLSKSEAILIGPGWQINKKNKNFLNTTLKKFKNKKFILDAAALAMLDKRLLNKQIVITPHQKEFKKLFNKAELAEVAKKYSCTIVLKGSLDYIAQNKKIVYNTFGNQGMTKGGTGDVLAGLIAALACKNDLFLAAQAGVLLNGLAGETLKKRFSYYYHAQDLVEEIPKIFNKYG